MIKTLYLICRRAVNHTLRIKAQKGAGSRLPAPETDGPIGINIPQSFQDEKKKNRKSKISCGRRSTKGQIRV
jgi:hypothetical protein